jgi:WD40 repeat protein
MLGDSVQLVALDRPADGARTLIGQADQITAFAFGPDSGWLATGDKTNRIEIWSTSAPATEPLLVRRAAPSFASAAFSADARWLALPGCDKVSDTLVSFLVPGCAEGSIRLWATDQLTRTPAILRRTEQSIDAVAFSPDGQWLAALDCSGGGCGGVSVWSLTDLAGPPVRLAEGQDFFAAISFSPDGRLLAATNCIRFEESQCTLGTVQVWAVDHFASTPMTLRHSAGSLALAFSLDGHYLAVTSRDGSVSIWNLRVDELMNIACRLVNRNFTRAEWDTFFFGQPYRKTCEQWPEGE